jgi:hypothetical protein
MPVVQGVGVVSGIALFLLGSLLMLNARSHRRRR